METPRHDHEGRHRRALKPARNVRQIVEAPVTARKLGIVEGRGAETPPRAVIDLLRLIRLRAALVGQDRTVVVIGPMRLIARLKDMGLPENVECGHFGAIAGIDRWNAAAGLIVIGQMQPGPRIVEALRWQITEGELVQAIGRLRALRRGPDNPCFLDILNDVPLPISVDEVSVGEGQARPMGRHGERGSAPDELGRRGSLLPGAGNNPEGSARSGPADVGPHVYKGIIYRR